MAQKSPVHGVRGQNLPAECIISWVGTKPEFVENHTY